MIKTVKIMARKIKKWLNKPVKGPHKNQEMLLRTLMR